MADISSNHMGPLGGYRLSETRQSEGQSRQNPLGAYTIHQSISPNGLIRLDQFCYNCKIICPPGLQNPIRVYTTHQSISPNGLIRPEQFQKDWWIYFHFLTALTVYL